MPRGTPKAQSTEENSTTDPQIDFRDVKHQWIKFKATARCYIEGTHLEADQPVTLSPAGAWRQRQNHCLERTDDTVSPKTLTPEQVEDLEDGAPRVGPVPTSSENFKLVKN